LICPDGTQVFETLAIIHHITSRFGDLAPPQGTPQNDRYHQYLALLATSVYPAYHRQHHTRYYGDAAAAETIRQKARDEHRVIFDHLEAALTLIYAGKPLPLPISIFICLAAGILIKRQCVKTGRD
jgi:glutathione S-transferase